MKVKPHQVDKKASENQPKACIIEEIENRNADSAWKHVRNGIKSTEQVLLTDVVYCKCKNGQKDDSRLWGHEKRCQPQSFEDIGIFVLDIDFTRLKNLIRLCLCILLPSKVKHKPIQPRRNFQPDQHKVNRIVDNHVYHHDGHHIAADHAFVKPEVLDVDDGCYDNRDQAWVYELH